MKRIVLCAILAQVLFASCQSRLERLLPGTSLGHETITRTYTIIDYKDRASGGNMPEWVDLWLNSNIQGIEALGRFNNRYVFIGRNEGVQLNPLHMWREGFSPELDFPRLAAARIERRFTSTTAHPDDEFGAFYEALIRTASDAVWHGTVSEDDFWIRRRYTPYEEFEQELETWEFLILLSIDKDIFASQVIDIFDRVNPVPSPTSAQVSAANRIKADFFNGF